jgi:N-methylhydantoinase B
MIISCSGVRNTPAEVVEMRYPFLVEGFDLAPDSAGAGRYRGGLGIDMRYRVLEEAHLTGVVERTRFPGWGLFGGEDGRPNRLIVHRPDGSSVDSGKVTALRLPKGSVIECQTGGGGGYGIAQERDPLAVQGDLGEGYITELLPRRHGL